MVPRSKAQRGQNARRDSRVSVESSVPENAPEHQVSDDSETEEARRQRRRKEKEERRVRKEKRRKKEARKAERAETARLEEEGIRGRGGNVNGNGGGNDRASLSPLPSPSPSPSRSSPAPAPDAEPKVRYRSKFREEIDETPEPTEPTRTERGATRRKSRKDYRAKRTRIVKRIITLNGILSPWLTDHLKNALASRALRWITPGLRRMTGELPWILWMIQVVLMLVIGTTGVVGWGLPSWLESRWMVWVEEEWLGGWGWCDDAGQCQGSPFYSVPITMSNFGFMPASQTFSAMILFIALGGVLLLLAGIYILIARWTRNTDMQSLKSGNCCCISSCIPSPGHYLCFPRRLENRLDAKTESSDTVLDRNGDERARTEKYEVLMEWILWWALAWNVTGCLAIEVWVRDSMSAGMMGDDLKNALVGVSLSWVLGWPLYKSNWAHGITDEEEAELAGPG